MTLGNRRELNVHRLVASCLNDACRHVALIDMSAYPTGKARMKWPPNGYWNYFRQRAAGVPGQ
jgi:hypothetical protein